MVALPEHVHRVMARGKPYYYYHPNRNSKIPGQRVRLPNDPESAEFWQAYERLAGKPFQPQITARNGTFDALIDAYRASPEYSRKAKGTRENQDRDLKLIGEIWGERLVKGLRPRHALELRDAFADKPRKADHLISTLSGLIGWGVPRDYAESNPCREIGKLYRGEGYAAWEWNDIVYAREQLKSHLWQAGALALYTGQRQGDVLAMNWNMIAAGEIYVTQQKTKKPLRIPLHRDLQLILEAIPKDSVRILTNSRGQPWTVTGFKSSWRKEMNQPAFKAFRERGLVFHGLRKSAVCMLIEAGCDVPEVAAITGQSWRMVEHYAVMVNQRKLARSAVLKWEDANDE